VIFVVPFVGNQFFHLHHWYYSWIVGMHCNLYSSWTGLNNNRDDTDNNINNNNNSRPVSSNCCWWSRLCMSIFWGIYINGIGIFGRDPTMTCAVTLYQSQNQQCPYITLVTHIDIITNDITNDMMNDIMNDMNITTNTSSPIVVYNDIDIGNECCTMGYGNYTLDDLSYDITFYNHIISGHNQNYDDDEIEEEFEIGDYCKNKIKDVIPV